jgi:hypothetical protein
VTRAAFWSVYLICVVGFVVIGGRLAVSGFVS